MDPTQKELVQQTFAKIEPMAATAASLFYERLFQLSPSVRPLFRGDLKEQGRKLMATLGIAVRGLERVEQLVPVLEELGRRHAGWGVKDEHYDSVAAALLGTLEQALGSEWTPAVKQAWTTVYGVLASTMKRGAADAAEARLRASAVEADLVGVRPGRLMAISNLR